MRTRDFLQRKAAKLRHDTITAAPSFPSLFPNSSSKHGAARAIYAVVLFLSQLIYITATLFAA